MSDRTRYDFPQRSLGLSAERSVKSQKSSLPITMIDPTFKKILVR